MNQIIARPSLKLLAVLLSCCLPGIGLAAVSAEKAAELGKSLTPIGAEKAGNGKTIPDWEGGLTQPPEGFKNDGRYIDPFPDDKPLFTITAANIKEYEANLTEGQKALFKTFPDTYKMHVYKTRRSSSYPQYIYDETIKNATRVELVNEGNGFKGTVKGHPFPIPQSGIEAMWNHMMRYNTKGYQGYVNNVIADTNGDYTVQRDYLELSFIYNHPDTTLENFEGYYLYGFFKTVAPPSKTGEANLVHLPIDRINDKIGLWAYARGLGKVRRVGEVGYDNPIFEKLSTHDQLDMFNGPFDRYQFKLNGKREIYTPYNAYKLASYDNTYEDIIHKGHINQDLVRYELHRMWEVEANVRSDYSHIYKKRLFYIDEDSWQILLQDMYDERDEFWRTAQCFPINLYEIPSQVNRLQAHYDLQSRRYLMLYMSHEEREPIKYDWFEPAKYFSVSKLRRFASRGN